VKEEVLFIAYILSNPVQKKLVCMQSNLNHFLVLLRYGLDLISLQFIFF